MEDDDMTPLPRRGRKFLSLLKTILGLGFVICAALFLVLVTMRKTSCQVLQTVQTDMDFKSFDDAFAMYRLNAKAYPSTEQGLKALVEKPETQPIPRRWVQIMPKIYDAPWGHPYVYRFPGSRNPEKPEIISMGVDGVLGNRDDLHSE